MKTAVLFAGLQAKGTTSIAETVRTRDHTEHALRAFGAELTRERRSPAHRGWAEAAGIDATVPANVFGGVLLCAALLFEDSNLVLDALGMNPTRAALLDVITAMGGVIKVLDVKEQHGEMVGTIQVNRGRDAEGHRHRGCAVGAADR